MATANKANITKRIDVNRKLTYLELDNNFEEMKRVIDDLNSVADSVSIDDTSISPVTTWSSSKIDTEVGSLIDDTGISINSTWSSDEIDFQINALIDDAAVALGTTWSSTKINSEFDAVNTAIGINATNISNKRDLTNNSFPRYDLASISTTDTLDLATGNTFTIDASVARTLTFANIPAGRSMTVVLTISGASAITWPAGIRWHGDGTTAPELGATWTIVVLSWDGANWSGVKGAAA